MSKKILKKSQSLPVETSNGTAIERIHHSDTRYTIGSTYLVPLPEDEDSEDELVDLGHLTTDKDFIQVLKTNDPFLFFSIPEVRKRSLSITDEFLSDDDDDEDDNQSLNEDDIIDALYGNKTEENTKEVIVETTTLPKEEAASSAMPRRRSSLLSQSCPAGMLANAEIRRSLLDSGSTVVSRSRRLAVEGHASLVMEEHFKSSLNSGGTADTSFESLCGKGSIDINSEDEDEDDDFEEPLRLIIRKMSSKRILEQD